MNKAAARWSLVALVLVIGMIYALWPRQPDVAAQPDTTFGQGSRPQDERRASDTDEALAPLREAAGLDACPTPSGTSNGPLAGISLECAADGTTVDVGAALAGRPALINLWAYWCGPCAEELPYLQEYADRAAGQVRILTVHQDSNEANGLAKLADYGVRLPGVQDGSGRIASAVGAPNVLPVSILVAADGSVVKVLPQPFRSVDEIAEAVRVDLGVVT